MMFHQRRYKKYIKLKNLLDGGALGEIKRVQLENSRYFRTWMYHRSGSWRSSWAGEGGGALLNQGQHILDIWQWLFGMPTSIYAVIPYGKYNDFMVDDEVYCSTLIICIRSISASSKLSFIGATSDFRLCKSKGKSSNVI